jgi:copper(I)-binding protein
MKRATTCLRGPRRPALNLLFALTLALPAALAQALTVVNEPWIRPAAAGHSTEAFMNLTSTEGATLVAARSDSAAGVTLQRPGRGMGTIAALPLPAGTIVELAPGKYRLLLQKLTQTVRLGDIVPLTVTVRGADGVTQDIVVSTVARLRSPIDDERRSHHHH